MEMLIGYLRKQTMTYDNTMMSFKNPIMTYKWLCDDLWRTQRYKPPTLDRGNPLRRSSNSDGCLFDARAAVDKGLSFLEAPVCQRHVPLPRLGRLLLLTGGYRLYTYIYIHMYLFLIVYWIFHLSFENKGSPRIIK